MTVLRKAQLEAYVSAVYEVEVDGRWIDALALAIPDSELPAALISASNPYSQLLPDSENSERHQHLRSRIAAFGCACHAARGRDADSSWIEDSWLVWAPLNLVDQWARAYQQHAVYLLPAQPGDRASLRIYSEPADGLRIAHLGEFELDWSGCDLPSGN